MYLHWRIVLTIAFLTTITIVVSSSTTEEDFAFETDEITLRTNNDECSVRRLWGIPNMPAYVGRMFYFHIPKEAFAGKVAEYKIIGEGNILPKWLTLDSRRGILRGVPIAENLGEHRLKVIVHSTKNHKSKCPPATDTFTIEVKENDDFTSSLTDEKRCHTGEDETLLTLYISEFFSDISPKQRIIAIVRLANFMGLNQSEFLIQPHENKGKHSSKTNKYLSEIQIVVGCSGKLWPKHSLLVHQIHEQVKQGSISFITQLPINAWKLIEKNNISSVIRKQRAAADDTLKSRLEEEDGSGFNDDEYEDGDENFYSGNYDYDEEGVSEVHPGAPPPTIPPTTTTPYPPTDPPHHHRHHHGEPYTITPEEKINPEENIIDYEEQNTQSPSTTITIPSTPIEIIPDPDILEESSSVFSSSTFSEMPVTIAYSSTQDASSTESVYSSSSDPELPSPSPLPDIPTSESVSPVTFATHTTLPVEDTTIFVTDDIVTQEPEVTKSNKTTQQPTESSSTDKQSSSSDVYRTSPTSEESTPTVKQTTPIYSVDPREILPATDIPETDDDTSTFTYISPSSPKESSSTDGTTEHPSTVIGQTTEIVRFTLAANSPPQKQHRTKKVAVTAGKYFSYIIPEDLFIDVEDGTNLALNMYDIEHTPLKSTSWVQFNPETREVYGLPLEEHVSKWEYIVEATDSKGLSVTDTLDITVQQHKGRRTVNHEFSMKLRIQEKYSAAIDWQIKILKGLVSLFRDTDMDQITVRDVDIRSDPVEFIWTNDTLPKNYCPQSDISRLMGILQSNSDGEPSAALISTMSPELRVKSVTWKGTGPCQTPAPTPPLPVPPIENFSPVPRNQIDHINATVGKLLVFKVPEDTFYDPEDGGASNLKMWLTKGNGSPLHASNWLQFDTKNQEFFGLPTEKDAGRADYQLVCEDKGGLTGKDILLVEVHQAPHIKPTVEFSMTLDSRSDNFMNSALWKRKFIDKLQQLFNDKDASNIRIKSITDRPTVINWYNTSLPTDRCPENDIKKLRKVLVREDETLTERLDVIMGPDFPVMSVTLNRKGACMSVGAPIIPDVPPKQARPVDETSKTASSDDYLITFIVPIAVIVCMLFVAALIACILYKRRRTGKMSVGDEEERQAFRSNGIPIIFQDELDEKPDSTNKSPVIMKEEKPPLLPPPEYKGIEGSSPTPSHTPYHPPPPFTASRDTPRNNRPKPSPAYRKPPPYVPP